MFASSRRLNSCDFLLFGSSIALACICLWPRPVDRKLVKVRDADGQTRSYSIAIDDPKLTAITTRLRQWENQASSRALRTAQWHAEVADYYCQIDDKSTSANTTEPPPVAQVSFVDSERPDIRNEDHSFWSQLAESARKRVQREMKRIERDRETTGPPVVLGSVTKSIGSPAAYPIACFTALATVGLAIRRQRLRPPIELGCTVEQPVDPNDVKVIRLQVPDSWVRIRQPAEVMLWRHLYAVAVGLAIASVIYVSLR